VRPFFGLASDGSGVADGVYVDEVRVLCRDATYADAITDPAHYTDPGAGNYVRFNGTSMATPHVAGIAALVRSADPSASALEVVSAIKASATPRPSLAGRVATGGSANALRAIEAALAAPTLPPSTPSTPPPSTSPPLPPSGAARTSRVLDLSPAPGRIRLRRSRSFGYSFWAAPGLNGRAAIRTRSRVRLPGNRRGRLPVAFRRFRSPASGRVTLRIRLSRRALTALRLNRRLRLRVQVSVVDSQGRVTRGARTLALVAPR
jgi:Subtilase family